MEFSGTSILHLAENMKKYFKIFNFYSLRSDLQQTIVGTVFILLIFVSSIFLFNATYSSILAGGVVVILGLALRIGSLSQIARGCHLETSGLFSFVRYPQLLGQGLIIIGSSIAIRQAAILGAAAGLLFLWYALCIQTRDAILAKQLGANFGVYRYHVPAFIPGLHRYKRACDSKAKTLEFVSLFQLLKSELYSLVLVLLTFVWLSLSAD